MAEETGGLPLRRNGYGSAMGWLLTLVIVVLVTVPTGWAVNRLIDRDIARGSTFWQMKPVFAEAPVGQVAPKRRVVVKWLSLLVVLGCYGASFLVARPASWILVVVAGGLAIAVAVLRAKWAKG